MKRLAALAALLIAGCEQSKDWQGWVYPDRNDLTDDIPIGAFSTRDECAATAKAILIRFENRDENGDEIIGDYECGFKCKPDGGLGGLNVCEKTER